MQIALLKKSVQISTKKCLANKQRRELSMTEKKEEKKFIRVRKDDGSKVYISAEMKGKPDKLFVWKDECRRGLGN